MLLQSELDELKTKLYRLPKEVIIEKILPEFALAHAELPRYKEEHSMLLKIAPEHDMFDCHHSGCRSFCAISEEHFWFSFIHGGPTHEMITLPIYSGELNSAVEKLDKYGVYCWECQGYSCPEHWREQMNYQVYCDEDGLTDKMDFLGCLFCGTENE